MQTLFSTSFFDFKPQDQQNVVSGWIWLYFLLTALLTVIIQGSWYINSRRKELQIAKALAQRPPAESLPTTANNN